MWTRQCVQLRKPLFSTSALVRAGLICLCTSFFALVLATLAATPLCAAQIIITAVTLNQEPKGEFFIVMQEDGDFLMSPADLRQIGLEDLPEDRVRFEGDAYVSLRGTADIDFSFDESNLTLTITADPSLLGSNAIDLAPIHRERVYYPQEHSFFLNYGIDYTTDTPDGGSSFLFQGYNISHEIGLRLGHRGVLLSDGVYAETRQGANDGFVRLNTRYVYDQTERLQRFTAGDFIALSGDLGSRVQMGGVSLSKAYQIDPYFIEYPLFDFSGMLPFPSEVEVYVDGVKTRTERFSPGEFQIRNFQAISGAQTVELVIRDSFGREQRITLPIYGTDRILQRGLHEYSYNLGFLRQDFGTFSNHYDELAFSAYHRYGVTDQFNVGWRAEGSQHLANAGIETALVDERYGLFRAGSSFSASDHKTGFAGQVIYDFRTTDFSLGAGLQFYSKNYRSLADMANTENILDRKLSLGASLGYLTNQWGSFGLRYREVRNYREPNRREVTLSWSRHIYRRVYLNSSVSLVDERSRHVAANLSVNWQFGQGQTVSAGYQKDQDTESQFLEIYKNPPPGLGTGYRLKGEHSKTGNRKSDRLDGYIQHNTQYATLRTDVGIVDQGSQTTTTAQFAVGGAMVYVGETFGLTRPVRDSFALVNIGNSEDIRVYANGQTVARTNRNGQAFIPDLSSYFENRVKFEDEDVPLDYLMPQVEMVVAPPLRSGSCLNFPLSRYQAYTGRFLFAAQNGPVPLKNVELTLEMPEGPLSFWTDATGEFYLDSQIEELDVYALQGCENVSKASIGALPAGTYPLTWTYETGTYRTEITIPISSDTYVDLGKIILPNSPASRTRQQPSGEKDGSGTRLGLKKPSAHLPGSESVAKIAAEGTEKIMAGEDEFKYVLHLPFDSSSHLLEEDRSAQEAEVLQYLKNHPDLPVEIEGYASKEPSSNDNPERVLRRILAVKAHLVEAGIEPRRIRKSLSFGEERPEYTQDDEDCLNQHRRALLIVVKSAGN